MKKYKKYHQNHCNHGKVQAIILTGKKLITPRKLVMHACQQKELMITQKISKKYMKLMLRKD